MKLTNILKPDHYNFVFTQRELAMLRELVELLQPLAEATDLLQGDEYPTIGCIVPSIVGLYKCLTSFSSTVKYHGTLVNIFLTSLYDRFDRLLQNVQILPIDKNF